MRRGCLVRRDELVDLGAGHPPGTTGSARQPVQPLPRGAVGCDERVEVHSSSATSCALPPSCCGQTSRVSGFGYVAPDSDRFITGEAVALDLRVARAGSRTLAFAIDAALLVAVLVGVFLLAGWILSGRTDPALAAAVFIVLFVACFVGLPVAVETLTRGRSVGKLALGLRVVRDDGGPIRFRQALVRGLAALFELYLFTGVPALIPSLASRQGKRVGDYMAGTIVLQERVPARGGPPVPMPPQLAPWAANADLSCVGDSLALAARQFLRRAQELYPTARAPLEAQLPRPAPPVWA